MIIGCKCPAGHLDGMMILLFEYILCAFAHIVVTVCIFLVARAFLALSGKNDKH